MKLEGAPIISIHAPHTGRDPEPGTHRADRLFQSTRPIRGATTVTITAPLTNTYFNPRAPYGARQVLCVVVVVHHGISIHAPHAGRDHSRGTNRLHGSISIHAPHAGRDFCLHKSSRPSVAISIHAPHAGRDPVHRRARAAVCISIHAPHAGRDPLAQLPYNVGPYFNPRAPCGARRAPSADRSITATFQSTRPMRGATSRVGIGGGTAE